MSSGIDDIRCPASYQHVRPVRDPSSPTIDGRPGRALHSSLLPTVRPLVLNVGEPGARDPLKAVDCIHEGVGVGRVNVPACLRPSVGRPAHC